MKMLLLILIGFGAPACFGQSTVNFHLQNAFGRVLAVTRVNLTPVPNLSSFTNSAGQITGDFLSFVTDTNGNYSATNVAAGTYQQTVYGPTVTSTNYLLVLPGTNTINAKDWVTIYPTGLGFILYEEAGVVGGRIVFEP